MGVCEPLCRAVFFSPLLQRGYLLRRRSDDARVDLPVCVGAAQRLSLLCVSVSVFVSVLQSSPQNRPLIIVWCVSGSAVGSYKKRLDVFIADRQRGGWSAAGRPVAADYRGKAWRPFQRATGTPPSSLSSSPFSSTLHGSSVWL